MELDETIRRLKSDKGQYAIGLVAELLKSAPDNVLQNLHGLFNHVFCPEKGATTGNSQASVEPT